MTTGYFDIETQYLFNEVGGRGNLDKLRLSVACLIVDDESPEFYEEPQAVELLERLEEFDLIVGHNLIRFDYPVLNAYVDYNVARRLSPKTMDTLAWIYANTNYRVSLNNLARNNIGEAKSGYGGDMPRLWREGKKDEVKMYCAHDVELTKGIYLAGKQNGYIMFSRRLPDGSYENEPVKLLVNW